MKNHTEVAKMEITIRWPGTMNMMEAGHFIPT